ncbi:polysaccharide pyruvyl transferase family protein [Vibrio breoganii]|uniref:polysaccharide pyruvyl transferase family protein n=1 Tax=Vibrio breoganii TaxID=553239 RepID=UPI000C8434F6|nr:polysaccharide pyruvyl transferase family protein [Vibrio breoganii]PMJ45293.1 hypothetical protein BCU21_13890 [Vibrio breoganii]
MKKNIYSTSLYDPSLSTSNVGDEIISESVQRELRDIFPETQFLRVSTHYTRSRYISKKANSTDLSIVGGSNLLSPKMLRYRQFKFSFYDLIKTRELLLMGVGWQYYQDQIDFLARYFYRNNLNEKYLHSVRDQYTLERLKSIGVENVINTGCPTMWRLTKDHCKKIKKEKSSKVVVTLTDYSRDFDKDKNLFSILLDNYDEIYFWPQGLGDIEYIDNLGVKGKVTLIPPRLHDYNCFLDNNDCDYIGTRLHGGIKALQKSKRTIIIGIDNRANEKKKDFNICVVKRSDIDTLDDIINSSLEMNISINSKQIEVFKSQFKD